MSASIIISAEKYLAHSCNLRNVGHLLQDHLRGVASKMEAMDPGPDYLGLFRITGLLHDFGKYQSSFQKYLREGGRRGSVPHASWGAFLALRYKLYETAFAIDGHHKGLPDKADLKDNCDTLRNSSDVFQERGKDFLLKDLKMDEIDFMIPSPNLRQSERELFIRYLFSALTDADWLDTEEHFNPELSTHRRVFALDFDFLNNKLETEFKIKSKEGELNQLRNHVRETAITRSKNPLGFFSMTLPTGMGKTLTSISWALHHAKYNDLKRIIIVLPFISIIDQTSKELKRIFGDEWVLEHHSNYNEDNETNIEINSETFSTDAYAKRLATENWDFPIIVTTTVQFFESLFANKPSRCRKLHNIARSVVIFDEVQTLPKELILPTLSILKDVHKVMRASFLFCTATQPAFDKTEEFNGIENIISLVENPEEVFNKTRRVRYFPVNNYKPVTLTDLAAQVLKKKVSTLSIFNTKKQTLAFYHEIRRNHDYLAFHLSTSMYPAHRKQVIEKIRECLTNQEKILVASTQLIEAGVDFDFPCVFREIAPLESIIQSAGRCNREGKIQNQGEVYIFSLQERPRPMKQYYSLADFANSLYKDKEHLLFEHDFFKEYYRKAFRLFIPEDKYHIEENRQSFNFKKVSESYRLIDTSTTPVFVLCDESRSLYESVRYKPMLSRNDYRAMQQFSVQVYDNFLKENIGKLGHEPQGYWIWHGEYSEEFGINTDSPILIF